MFSLTRLELVEWGESEAWEILGHKDYRYTFSYQQQALQHVFRSIYADFPNRKARAASICDFSTRTGIDSRHPFNSHAYGKAFDLQYYTFGDSNRTQSPRKEVEIWTGGMLKDRKSVV